MVEFGDAGAVAAALAAAAAGHVAAADLPPPKGPYGLKCERWSFRMGWKVVYGW